MFQLSDTVLLWRPSCRFTYAAYNDNLSSSRRKVVCHQEEVQNAGDPLQTKTIYSSSVYEPQDSETDIICVEPLPNSAAGDHEMITVDRAGRVAVHLPNLESIRWHAQLTNLIKPAATAATSKCSVDHVFTQNAYSASRKLLKRRKDLVATLGATSDDALKCITIIGMISRRHDSENKQTVSDLYLLAIYPHDQSTTRRDPIRHLVSWEFPAINGLHGDAAYSFDEASGLVNLLQGDSICTFDFSDLKPKVKSRIRPSNAIPESIITLPNGHVAAANKDVIWLCDVTYQAQHAIQHSDPHGVRLSRSRKRKRETMEPILEPSIPMHLVSYFPTLGILTAIRGNELISLSVTMPRQEKMVAGSRLVDAIGRAQSTNFRPCIDGAEYIEKQFQALDELAANWSTDEFDEKFMVLVDDYFSKSKRRNTSSKHFKSDKRALLKYLLSKIFAWSSGRINRRTWFGLNSPVEALMLPRRAWAWAVETGHFSPGLVAEILRSTPHPMASNAIFSFGCVIDALVIADPTLDCLTPLLEPTTWLPLQGNTIMLKHLIRSFDILPWKEEHLILTEKGEPLTNGTLENEIQKEEENALADLEIAEALFDQGAASRAQCLRWCIERLGTLYSPLDVAKSFRTDLSTRDMKLLVEFLQIELEQGDWTSWTYDHLPDDEDLPDGPDGALKVICSLLNAVLDAVGIGGWLGETGSYENDSGKSIISTLRAQISFVLEGIQESAYLSGYLRDFIRLDLALKASRGRSRGHGVHSNVISSRDGAFEPAARGERALPLGLNSVKRVEETRVEETRVGPGGAIVARSKRDVGRQLAKKVGKYSFETLRI